MYQRKYFIRQYAVVPVEKCESTNLTGADFIKCHEAECLGKHSRRQVFLRKHKWYNDSGK